VIALFSRYFGWDIDYILNLTPLQISALQEGLGDILAKENGGKTREEEESEYNPEVNAKRANLLKNQLEAFKKVKVGRK